MNYRGKTLASFSLLALSLTTLPCTQAGTATVSSGPGDTAIFEYAGDMLRINSDQPDSYVVVRDGNLYAVSFNDGQPMVIDAGSMMKGMANMIPQVIESDLDARLISLKDTGKGETVAGISGDVYELTFEDENGAEQKETLVLSTDKRALEFRDALFNMMSFAAKIADTDQPPRDDDVSKRLMALDAGVLRYGSEMTVTEISGDPVPAQRFELPAEPLDMQGLGGLFGAMSQGSSGAADSEGSAEEQGGLFSSMMGALGGKVERQEDRAGDAVDQEIDEQTDEAVDNALGKAFGKLFGR